MNVKLANNIFSVGYVDWNIRDFHSYNTAHGATYNSYLIKDKKNVLIDAVKAPYVGNLIKHIEVELTLDEIDYIVCNHAELDHSGGLEEMVRVCKNAVVVCNAKCQVALGDHFDISTWNFKIVEEGEQLSIGARTLQFINTPMVHWPESMFTFVVEDGILFSMDAFGQHYASEHRFDDEVDLCDIMHEAKTYYATIVMSLGAPIAATLEKAAGLDIKMIAPAHGVIWRSHIADILELYKDWVVCKPKPKVLVIYDSMWESTKTMAEAIVDGISSQSGVDAKLIYIRGTNLTEIATEVLDCAGIAFGSSTLNNGMMPMAGATLTYLKGLRPEGKIGFSFGSYGWGGGGAEAVHQMLQETGIAITQEPLTCRYKPTKEVLDECYKSGANLAVQALALMNGEEVSEPEVAKKEVTQTVVSAQDEDVFQRVLDDCSYGLYVITSHSSGKLNGQISDALMQVTACPKRVAVSINQSELTHEYIKHSGVFGVTILDKTTDMKFIGHFGFKSGRDINKLETVEHKIGQTGVPLVQEHAISTFECKVVQEVDLDTHTMFIGEVVDAAMVADADVEPLTYHYYQKDMKGKAGANSPSAGKEVCHPENDEEVIKISFTGGKKYVCTVCNWVYDPAIGDPDGGITAGTAFEDIPDDWKCPVCGVSKSDFVLVGG